MEPVGSLLYKSILIPDNALSFTITTLYGLYGFIVGFAV